MVNQEANQRFIEFCEKMSLDPTLESSFAEYIKFMGFVINYRKWFVDGNPPFWNYEGLRGQDAINYLLKNTDVYDQWLEYKPDPMAYSKKYHSAIEENKARFRADHKKREAMR